MGVCMMTRVKEPVDGKFYSLTTTITASTATIALYCHRPSGPKPEKQHNRRRRGMLTLTWEEVTITECNRRCCSCTKKEIKSLGFYLKVIYKFACKESCILQCQQCQKVGVGTLPMSERIHILYLTSTYKIGIGWEVSLIPICVI